MRASEGYVGFSSSSPPLALLLVDSCASWASPSSSRGGVCGGDEPGCVDARDSERAGVWLVLALALAVLMPDDTCGSPAPVFVVGKTNAVAQKDGY
jgi:hypothetical protein